MASKGHDARRLRAADRRAVVLDMRRSGESFRAIAARLCTPLSTVHKDYDRALAAARALESTEADAQRALDLIRLDAWLIRLAPHCDAGSPAHIGTALRCLERRARLLGLDAPVKVAPTDPAGHNPYASLPDEELRLDLLRLVTALTGADRAAARGGTLPLEPDRPSEPAAP